MSDSTEPGTGDLETDMRIVEEALHSLHEDGADIETELVTDVLAVIESLQTEADSMADVDPDAEAFLDKTISAFEAIEDDSATDEDVDFAKEAMTIIGQQMITMVIDQTVSNV